MKQMILAAAILMSTAAISPAFADRWVEPVNGNVSAVMMPDGDVMMKIQIPAKEFAVIDRDMKANHPDCTIHDIDSDEADTMILVCKAAN